MTTNNRCSFVLTALYKWVALLNSISWVQVLCSLVNTALSTSVVFSRPHFYMNKCDIFFCPQYCDLRSLVPIDMCTHCVFICKVFTRNWVRSLKESGMVDGYTDGQRLYFMAFNPDITFLRVTDWRESRSCLGLKTKSTETLSLVPDSYKILEVVLSRLGWKFFWQSRLGLFLIWMCNFIK